jgi:hypothetical protein
MARYTELEDDVVDQLLRGTTPTGREDLAPVAELAASIRDRACAHAPVIGPTLRRQLHQAPPVPPRYAGVARRRLRLAAASLAAAVIVGIGATQNALPASAQRFVSVAAHHLGIDLPRPEDKTDPAPAPSSDAPDPETGVTSGGSEAPDGSDTPASADDPTTAPSDSTGHPPSGTPGGGPPPETPGGATPADPGTPGDHQPATPAVPPAHSNGGGNGNNGQRANADRRS